MTFEPLKTYRSMRGSSRTPRSGGNTLGPTNISGRATDIAVADAAGLAESMPATRRAAYGQPTTTAITWQPIFDHYASTSIGDLAVAPSNPDIVWVGTGEANIFRASMPGVGVFKSSDGGRTFAHMGLDRHPDHRPHHRPSRRTPTSCTSPRPAMSGPTTRMRGVFKTTDGGRNWKKVFYRSPRTGAIDLVMDPADPEHALRGDVAAHAAQVERSARRARLQRRRHLEDHRRRQQLDRGQRRPAGAAVPRPHRHRHRRARIRTCSTRSWTTTSRAGPPREGERDAYSAADHEAADQGGRDLSHRRQRHDVAQGVRVRTTSCPRTPAPTAGCSARFASIPRTTRRSTRLVWG